MSDKNNFTPTPEQLGIPSGSYDPLKNIEAEGDLYRRITKHRPRSFIFRIGTIIMGVFFISIFPLFVGVIYLDPPQGDEFIAAIYMIFLGILFFIIGLKIIKSNINLFPKKTKK